MDIEKKGYIWNTVAGIVNAAEAVIMLMIVTRFSTIENAGILTLAFAVGNLLMTIGKFGVRYYQITDQKEPISFSTYFLLRIISIILMTVAGIAYIGYGSVFNGYTRNKVIVILCVLLIYAYESYEDLYSGRFQQLDRIDIGAKIFSFRWFATIGVFSFVLVVLRRFILAIIFATMTSIVIGIILLRYHMKGFDFSISDSRKGALNTLFINCFPLFCSSFLSYYLTNAPKYMIDRYMSDEEQACFGFIFMPVFVIELLNNFLYQPIVVKMTREWNDEKYKEFLKRIIRQIFYIFILSIFVYVIAYFLGIPVLSVIYNTDLSRNKNEFLLLMIGGGIVALEMFLSVVLTIMRKQVLVLYVLLFFSLVTCFCLGRIVGALGLFGASLYFLILNAVITIVLLGIIKMMMKKKKDE